MAIKTISEHDRLIYRKNHRGWFFVFRDLFGYKEIRSGVYVLHTNSEEKYKIEGIAISNANFEIEYVKGKKFDANNKIVCEDDINVICIFDSAKTVEFGRKPRCLFTLLAPTGKKIGHNIEICELNFNQEEINAYINERQIEKFKEEIKAAELKKALKQIAKKRLIEEGVLCDEEHHRPYIPQDVVGLVYMRYDGKCCKCGSSKDLQLDHIIPFSKGGSSEVDNLQLLCKDCNLKKGNKFNQQ